MKGGGGVGGRGEERKEDRDRGQPTDQLQPETLTAHSLELPACVKHLSLPHFPKSVAGLTSPKLGRRSAGDPELSQRSVVTIHKIKPPAAWTQSRRVMCGEDETHRQKPGPFPTPQIFPFPPSPLAGQRKESGGRCTSWHQVVCVVQCGRYCALSSFESKLKTLLFSEYFS